ncbi:transcription factor TFIIIB component B'' homolog isoform X1 [Vidua chalybeata]|nr:transcription factor TFIIIB component B'' homolog isoform X1 [Vidua chalybeata]
MFRRARLTVRPNVRPLGRAAAAGTGAVDPEPPEPPGSDTPAADGSGTAPGSADARREESDDKADNASGAGEASKHAEIFTQRRKRISTMPNLVKPIAGPSSAQCSAPKPQRRTSQASDGIASLHKDPSPSEKSNVESSVKSPMLPEKKTPVPQVPQFSPLKKSVNKEQTVGVAAQKNDDSLQKNVPSPLKERPTQERSRTQEEKLPVKPSHEKVKRSCSDRERILKARKLREMLKEELKKERMKLKHRPLVIEGHSPPDRSKMTMRDLIYYLPENNPMKSSLIEEKRTERSSALSQMKEHEEKSIPHHEEEEEEEEENGEESQDSPLLVPRVKVAEDGSIILDEESLTVEVLRTKGPCVVEENDPIFERGSTTTYSSFRKSFYTKPWSNKETDMFFLAISMVGTDFSLIGRLFPHRARAEIKNKFKREEKANGWRIDKAFKEKRPFDFEFFAQLLEKVLADEGKRKQKTVKSQKPKEKKSPRPQKKSKAKAASTEAANDQDELQEAEISDAETEVDGVTAEKENEESLGLSEQAEEEVALEPALAKNKRKRKRKDDFEQEVENIPEVPVPSKTSEEGKSSNKRKKVIHDASSDGDTTCGNKADCAIEGEQNESAVTEEERSESCSSVNNQMERERDVNLCSLEDSNDVTLEAEPAKLRSRDIKDDTSQESQIPELPVSNIRSKERECVETTESKTEDTDHLQKTDGKQSASECGSQSEIMKTEKSADRRRWPRPKPNLVRSSGRRETAAQDKMEGRTSSPTLENAGEKCSEDESRRNKNEATEVDNRDLATASQEPEKAAIAKTIVRGYQQRFKPNVTRASGRKEEPEKDAGNDEISYLQPKGETEKNNDQGNRSDDTSEDTAEKDDKVLETMSQSNETAGLKEDSKWIVLNQTPLKRGRIQRPKPNLGRTVARQKELIDEKDPEVETAEGGKAEKGVTHHRDENNDLCLKCDLAVHEGTQPSSVTLKDVSADSEMNSNTRQCFQEKSSEGKSNEREKGLSDVSKQASDSITGESHPQKKEEKTVVSSAWPLRTQLQRPKPNLRITSRKEVLDVKSKSASQKDTSKGESLTQCDSECSIPPDTDKGICEVLNALESLGKEKSLCSQEVSERPNCKSPKTFSRSEDGELEFCLPEISQDDISTTVAGAQEEHQYAPLPPIQLAQNKRYKPNLVRAIGKQELQISENESKKKPEAQQRDEFDNTVMGENAAVLCEADVLSKEEEEQQEMPQMLSISETLLSEQSRSSDKLSSGEESEQRGREPHWNPRPDLMRLTRKRDYPEECENRKQDNTERNEEEFLVLLKTGVSGENSGNTVEAGSFSEATRSHNFAENFKETSCKRIRENITLQSLVILSESERHVEQDNDSQLSTSQEKHSDNLTRRQFRRSSKQTALPEHVLEPKPATSSASECEADCSEKGSQRQEAKLSVTRDKSLKTTQRRKSGKESRSSKITFVTLRASQEEEDEEADDFELDDEDECFASEEVNKAPAFVPIGLRSPKPIPVQIQETVEELEISVNIPDVAVDAHAENLSFVSFQPVVQREDKSTSTAETIIHENPDVDKGINDGSTEAAMTLLAMGDPNFQLKTSTEEQTHMLPAQNDLGTAHSLVIHAYSKENRASSQYLLASDTSIKELLPSEDGSNINVKHQTTGTRIGVEEYSEMDATDTSGSSLPTVNSMGLTGGGCLESESTTAILRSNENIMQDILNANVLVEQLEQIQTDPTTLRGNAEMQKVEPEPIRPVAGDSSAVHDFASRSMAPTKQVDRSERTEKQIRDACGNSGDLRHLTASPKPEKSHLGLEDCPNPSSVEELSEQSPCPLEHHICAVSFTQNEAYTQDAQRHCISSTEETSVVNYDHRCPEEEQTFILTLVEIPAGSKEFDASAMVEQTSEPVLPAPILISPMNTSETTVTEVESIGSLTTAAGKVAGPLNSTVETKQLESAVDPVPKLQIAQKQLAAELEENDFPPSKKTPSTVAVENKLETTYKGYSIKSTDVPVVTSGNLFQKTESSAKEKVLTSVLVSESISQLAERSQLETLESCGKAPFENVASEKEEEAMSRLTSNRRGEISRQGKQENVHESAQLEHTRSLASSSKTLLLRGGRKPLGFLSLICKKSNSESAEDTKGNRGKIQKPRIVTPKPSLKKPTPPTKDEKESCSFPSTSSSVEHELVAADAAVMVLSNSSSEKQPLCAKEKEGEPTKISEYFFSDIFMEVDDSE